MVLSLHPLLLLPQTLFEPLLKEAELRDQVSQGVHKGIRWVVVRCGLHPNDNLEIEIFQQMILGIHPYLIFKWAWIFVPRKDHIWVLEQLMPDHVAQCVVLLVQGEDGRIGYLRVLLPRDLLLPIKEDERLKGGRSVHH